MGAIKDLRQQGIEATCRFLERQGYEIAERGWCCGSDEVDIICTNEGCLVMVDVDTRSGSETGLSPKPESSDARGRFERIAAGYLASHDVCDMRVRYDRVSLLVMSPSRAFLRHHIDALPLV